MILKQGHTKPGDCMSADHYISAIQGCLFNTFGREKQGYTCGTLFVDHASGKIFNFCQVSTSASEHKLETLAAEEGFEIKAYHSDNGTFASSAFTDDCHQLQQKFTFSGVGAHHQNGFAECNIQTVVKWACASMLHAALHWPSMASIVLWSMEIAYTVWVFNCLPQMSSGLCPNEIWSQSCFAHDDFSLFGGYFGVMREFYDAQANLPTQAPKNLSQRHSTFVTPGFWDHTFVKYR